MRIIEIDVSNPRDGRYVIGKRGENNYCEVHFKISDWISDWPDGTVQALYWRPDGRKKYLTTDATGEEVVWVPNRSDLAVAGTGLVEFRLVSGETLGKQEPIFVMIRNAPKEGNEEPDEEFVDWATSTIEQVEGMKDDAENAANQATSARNEVYEYWQSYQPLSILDVVESWNTNYF